MNSILHLELLGGFLLVEFRLQTQKLRLHKIVCCRSLMEPFLPS